jgi:hypothetical protein
VECRIFPKYLGIGFKDRTNQIRIGVVEENHSFLLSQGCRVGDLVTASLWREQVCWDNFKWLSNSVVLNLFLLGGQLKFCSGHYGPLKCLNELVLNKKQVI